MFLWVTSALLQVGLCCLEAADAAAAFAPSVSVLRRCSFALALTVAADAVLAVLGRLGAAATLRQFLVVSGQQSFDL